MCRPKYRIGDMSHFDLSLVKKNPLARGTAGLKFVRFVNHPADGVVD